MNEAAYKAKLTDYIAARINITDQDKELIANAYSLIEVRKKKHLFQQDEVCLIEGFVVQGTFRVYYLDSRGSEHVLYFAFPEWWVGDMVSFAGGDASGLSVQALEDSLILVIDPVKKEELYKQVPALERLFRIIVQKHLAVLQKRFLLTISANVSERYKELIQRSPGIEQLVPQHQIASYLGILPESLSRMKKQLLK